MKILYWQHYFKKLRLEHIYLFLALLFGTIMVFSMPPFQVMDEYNHFYKAYGLTQGNIFCIKDERGRPGLYIPEEIKYAPSLMGVQDIAYRPDIKIIPENIDRTAGITVQEDALSFVEHPFCESPFWASLPQAIGIGIGKIFHFPLLPLFYIGRFFNLLSAVFLIFLAIRKLPFGKLLFVFVALLPMFMQQISSYSLDAIHYALLFYFTATTLAIAYSPEPFSRKKQLAYLCMSLLALHAKIGFFPLLFLFFLIPKKVFQNTKEYILSTSILFMTHGVFLWFLRTIFSIGSYADQGSINRSAQIQFILTNPFEFAYIIFNSINTYFDTYWKNLFGLLGWMDYPLEHIHYLVLIIFLWFIFSNSPKIPQLQWKQRLILIFTFLLASSAVFAILYILDDSVGAPLVGFMQGKYLLPLFPLLLLSLYGIHVSKKQVYWITIIVTIGSIAGTVFSLHERYYSLQTTSSWLPEHSSGSFIEEISPSRNLFQSFVAQEANLTALSVYIPKVTTTQDSPLKIILRDATCQKIIFSSEVPAKYARAKGYYSIKFPPIITSKNTTYCLQLYPSFATALHNYYVEIHKTASLPALPLKIGKETIDGTVHFLLHYKK